MLIGLSILGYIVSNYKVIPYLIPINIKAGISGKDIYLKGTK